MHVLAEIQWAQKGAGRVYGIDLMKLRTGLSKARQNHSSSTWKTDFKVRFHFLHHYHDLKQAT